MPTTDTTRSRHEVDRRRLLDNPAFARSENDIVGMLAFMGWRHGLSVASLPERFNTDDPRLDHRLTPAGRKVCGSDTASFGRLLTKLWGIDYTKALKLCHAAYTERQTVGVDVRLPAQCDVRRDARILWQWLADHGIDPRDAKSIKTGDGTGKPKKTGTKRGRRPKRDKMAQAVNEIIANGEAKQDRPPWKELHARYGLLKTPNALRARVRRKQLEAARTQ